ncbi:hypothetical protein GYN07_20845 [Rhizobium leguminosarum bv. viciae 248]|uniref:hypothetical protein n=1 Tax=Rhizobium leguminosarum TaxID=384 RepID=UPI00037ACB89|nr:hypothetical protein [Rhizobium leguminosarum]QHW26631.1 hypothetical protein GYN07_20845 [Rhizobium leguminosarum bv. viciae 248]
MGKRSSFERIERDAYQTIDPKAVYKLLPHLRGIRKFAEPCAGDGYLVGALQDAGLVCTYEGDITYGYDALTYAFDEYDFDVIISNVPWERSILHAMIARFMQMAPTWLLFDADWAHTKQSAPFLDQCSHIVSVGRLKWIPGTKMTGKENCAWYRFHAQHVGGPHFIGHEVAA